MNLTANCKIGAIFKCVVRKAKTNEIVSETGEFKNLVLDTGLARMSAGTWIDRCVVGSGNSNPVVTQVALDNLVASTTTVATGSSDTGGSQLSTLPYYWYGRRTWRFNTGIATGNLSEIGVRWGNSNLWNRALIRDNAGNPTTITVLADEYLDVFCEVRVYPSDSNGSFNIVDKLGNIVSTHNYESKFLATGTSQSSGAYWRGDRIDTKFFCISASQMGSSNSTLIPSVAKNFSPINTYINNSINSKAIISSTEVNINHTSFSIAIIGLMSGVYSYDSMTCGYKWQISPPISKTNAMILTYSVTVSWERYT